jgi:hypothetical protein
VESDRRRLQREAGEAVDETAERREGERERERIRGASASFERGLSAAGGA